MSTITELARQLNLTKSTVSHALNGRPGKMSGETRERILRTARELGYAPNPAARALTASRTGNIGLISRRFNNALYTELLLELAIAVDERGGNLVTCITGRDSEHHGQDHLLHAGAVDGIFAFPYALKGLGEPGSPWMRSPIVFLLSTWEEDRAPSVRFDDASGAAQVATYLWGLGHRRVCYVQGQGPKGEDSSLGRERYRFMRQTWAELGGDPEADFTLIAAQATTEGGRSIASTALEGGLSATAVVTYNDQMAVGFRSVLHDRGVRTPEDVSLIGWNDVDEICGYLTPPLTSVRTCSRMFALAAAELLFERIERRQAKLPPQSIGDADRVRVPVELIVRGTTGPPPRRDATHD